VSSRAASSAVRSRQSPAVNKSKQWELGAWRSNDLGCIEGAFLNRPAATAYIYLDK